MKVAFVTCWHLSRSQRGTLTQPLDITNNLNCRTPIGSSITISLARHLYIGVLLLISKPVVAHHWTLWLTIITLHASFCQVEQDIVSFSPKLVLQSFPTFFFYNSHIQLESSLYLITQVLKLRLYAISSKPKQHVWISSTKNVKRLLMTLFILFFASSSLSSFLFF